ncbi:MAG: PKD domain-containing protein, partial [Candidatus Methanomethylophilaceae archaeon]|nr:PKD domain-containing protein [Candidatus Methanomethylophilaceae archaeon]
MKHLSLWKKIMISAILLVMILAVPALAGTVTPDDISNANPDLITAANDAGACTGLYGNDSYDRDSAGTSDAGIVSNSGSDGETPATAGLADTPWPKYQYDLRNSGQSPYVGSQNNTPKWSIYGGTIASYFSSCPAIGTDGTLYISEGSGALLAINPDGTLKYRVKKKTNNWNILGPISIGSDGTLYAGCCNKYVYAVHPSNGTIKWKSLTGAKLYGGVAIGADGTIYVASDALYAFNHLDGSLKWNSTTIGNEQSSSTPAIGSDGTIYIGSQITSTLHAYNPDGTLKWSNTTGAVGGSPAIGPDGIIYVGSADGNLYAWNPDGTLKWTYATGWTTTAPPAVAADGTVYISFWTTTDGALYAVKPDGTLKWTYATGHGISSAPVIGADGTIYAGGYAWNPDGTLKWKLVGISPCIPAIGQDGTMYFGASNKYLYALPGVVTFTADQTAGLTPLAVRFTGTSDLNVTSWHWDFGDGNTSGEQNPTHTYTVGGVYSVNLTIAHGNGTNTLVKTDYISAYSPLAAGFTADPTSGNSPLSVTFTDRSTGAPTAWLWEFGDGTTSTEQNPTHTYTAAGTDTTTYTVNLTATNSAGSNTTSRTDYITLYSSPPTVSFTATPRVSAAVPLTVQFRDASTLSPTMWFWEFGDGTTSTEQNPTHTYAAAGTYTVNLTATNIIGTSTASNPGFIALISSPLPSHNCINLYVANDAGVKYDEPNGVRAEGVYRYVPNTYYFASSGGLNALSISDGTNPVITNTRNQSGTFYAVHAGGQSTMPDGILMLAVNGTIPDDFSVHIKSSGYNWTPPGPDTKNYGLPAEHNYVDGAVDETFTKDDFIYGPQIWKPCSAANYPIHHGQNMSDTENAFQIMFIDLNAGATSALPDGQIKIEYQFNNLTTFAAFDVYAWYLASNHGTGIIMTNNVGESSYMVTGIPDTPVANFTVSTDSSDISSPVQFNDTSENIPQSWYWEFGDGATSTEQNPIHTYTTPGTYTVNLTVTNTKGTDTMVKTDCITKVAAPVPVADFAANVVPLGGSPVQVLFSDRSTGIVSSWLWDFGDGITSTGPNPGHWYYAPGTYTVNLTVTNSGGSTSCVKNITVSPAETAFVKEWTFESGTEEGFTGVDTWGDGINVSVSSTAHDGMYALQCYASRAIGYARAPLENVPDASTYRVDYWIQSSASGYGFTETGISIVDADGALIAGISGGDTTFTGTDFNVICNRPVGVWVRHVIGWEKDTGVIDHMVYDTNGTLLGSRQITRAASIGKVPAEIQCHIRGTNHYIQYDSITLSCGSIAHFTANVTSGEAPLAVQFTDTSTNSPTSWAWDFGDGTTSTDQSPAHTYTTAGTYTVNLTVTNVAGSNAKVRVNYITVTGGGSGGDAPVAGFTATPTTGEAPLAVQFTDTSSGTPTSWLWEFGDGVNSTEQNPAHTYADAGSYTVNLTATNGDGSNTLSRAGYITVDGGSYSGVLPGYTSIYVRPANHDGIRWDYTENSTYYINKNGGGLNAVHISTDPAVGAGQVTVSENQTGTFYVTDTGGRGYQDEVVLLLAVNGTIPDDFSIRIKTSGYTWTPNSTGNTAPPTGAYTYQPTALDETFTKDDFTYGPQDWKPSGSDVWYPIFYGQDSNDPVNRFQLAFIDTRAGLLGDKHPDNASLTDKGAVKVEYQFTNLSGHAAFSLYAWNNGTSHGQGMGWTNRLSGDGSSGYTVIPPSGATVPVAAFNATPTSGEVPLAVQFTDLSTGSPTAWAWDFGDNATSTERNPAHTYASAGTYSVNLTVTNAAGSNSLVKTDYITVTAPAAPDLTVSTLTPNNGEVFSAAANTYTAKITNIGTADAGAFSIGFNVSGVTGTIAVADGLAAGANTTVTWTDETVRTAGDPATVTATADPENSLAEADEENNLRTLEKTVVNNGYRGKRWTAGEDIMTVKTYDVRGDLAYSSGTSTYLSAG